MRTPPGHRWQASAKVCSNGRNRASPVPYLVTVDALPKAISTKTQVNSMENTVAVQDEGSSAVQDDTIEQCMIEIFAIQNRLRGLKEKMDWNGLGNLLGAYGEYLALKDYDLVGASTGNKDHDATDSLGRSVQIKACMHTDRVGFRGQAEALLVLKIEPDGTYREIYNGKLPPKWRTKRSKRDNKRTVSFAALKQCNPGKPIPRKNAVSVLSPATGERLQVISSSVLDRPHQISSAAD